MPTNEERREVAARLRDARVKLESVPVPKSIGECAAYDREDPDWACEDIFSTGEELFGFSSEDWEAALDLMLETMSEAIADGILPDAIEYVAVGFVDGDLEEVFCRE